jgi:hypothetical protein
VIPTHGQARQKAEELKDFLNSKVCGTFPRGVANRFIARFGEEGATFIADMEKFHATIADYCGRAGKWLQEDATKISEVRRVVGQPFFRTYKQYGQFEAALAEFPDLSEVMGLYEAARKRLVALMATLEQVKNR